MINILYFICLGVVILVFILGIVLVVIGKIRCDTQTTLTGASLMLYMALGILIIGNIGGLLTLSN